MAEKASEAGAPPQTPDWRRADDLRVLVCGGRNYADAAEVARTLLAVQHEAERGIGWIIHGRARGADRLADEWARANDVPVDSYPADWHKHGNAAGPLRNQEMLEFGTPDLVVAFPGGRGTADKVSRARRRGIPVIEAITKTARSK